VSCVNCGVTQPETAIVPFVGIVLVPRTLLGRATLFAEGLATCARKEPPVQVKPEPCFWPSPSPGRDTKVAERHIQDATMPCYMKWM